MLTEANIRDKFEGAVLEPRIQIYFLAHSQLILSVRAQNKYLRNLRLVSINILMFLCISAYRRTNDT